MKEIIVDLNKIQENPDIVLVNNIQEENDKTIVMSSLSNETLNTNNIKINKKEDYYDEDYYDDEDYKDKKINKKTIFVTLGIIVTILLLGTIGYFIAVGRNAKDKEVIVPSLDGLTYEKAKKEAELLGLSVEIIATEISDKEEGTVLKVSPNPGSTIKKDTILKLTVSLYSSFIVKFVNPSVFKICFIFVTS